MNFSLSSTLLFPPTPKFLNKNLLCKTNYHGCVCISGTLPYEFLFVTCVVVHLHVTITVYGFENFF